MIIDLIQDRKVLFEKFNKYVALENYFIAQMDESYVDDVVVFTREYKHGDNTVRREVVSNRLYIKDDVALFEESGDSIKYFYVKAVLWQQIKHLFNCTGAELKYVISKVLNEFFPGIHFKIQCKFSID